MKYDLSQISELVEDKRKKFSHRLSIIIVLLISSIALVIAYFNKNDVIVFWAALFILILIFLTRALFIRYSPTILFSKEIRGENILEDESVLLAYKRGFRMGSRTSVYAHHVGSRQLIGGERTRARVYLKLDSGDIEVIDHLSTAHIDLYEYGDILYKPAGARFPIIESRDIDKQPCPLCGRINTAHEDKCSCGIDIIK